MAVFVNLGRLPAPFFTSRLRRHRCSTNLRREFRQLDADERAGVGVRVAAAIRSRPHLLLGLAGRPQRQQEGSLGQQSLEAEELQRGPADVRLNHSEKIFNGARILFFEIRIVKVKPQIFCSVTRVCITQGDELSL